MKVLLIVFFFVYGIPFWKFRYQFRSAVYKDKSWKINIKPWFWKETIAMFSNRYFETDKERRVGALYRIYILIYIILLVALFL